MALTGSLAEAAAADVIQLIGMGRKTGVLTIVGKEDRALIYFDDGRPLHAVYGDLTGEDAVYAVLALASGDFSFESAEIDCTPTISDDVQALVLEGMRRLDHWRLAKENLPPPDAVLEPNPAAMTPEARAELTESEAIVLALVGDKRTLAHVLRLSGLPELQAAEVLWGLLSRGLVVVDQPLAAHPDEPARTASQPRDLAASDVRRMMEAIAAL